ncbi:MAG: transposase, partial [Deltaproteobacteria bacterium]
MMYNPDLHHRRSIRLKDYDYSQAGAYFVTICTHDKACLFGDIVCGEMQLNTYGQVAQNEWIKTTDIRPNVKLDYY